MAEALKKVLVIGTGPIIIGRRLNSTMQGLRPAEL